MAENINRNSYGNILKSIGLFGGVKVFQILVSIIKNKIVAVLIGPAGMGIVGLITSATGTVTAATGFGLHTSSVRDIAKATQSGDEKRIGIVVSVLRKLVIFTGLLGTAVTFLCAPVLSQWSFGNTDYTVAFRVVSVILFFDQLCVGQTALLQGTFHYKYMARSALFGSIIGLLVAVPLYYIWNINAIVPVIIISSLTNLILAWFYGRKIQTQNVQLTFSEIWKEGKGMLILGLAIALSGFVGMGQKYILQSCVSKIGSVADVGLYAAGIAIATQYIDVILQSMGTDYSPRLAAVSEDTPVFVETINRQTKLMLTIVTPLIIPFIVLIRELTILLYSTKFIDISGMIEWMMLGMFFRTTSWCLSYSVVARGESKKFFWNESLSCAYGLLFAIIGYKVVSFTGMGIAICLNYICYTLQMYILCRKSFGFHYNVDVKKTVAIFLPVLLFSFVVIKLLKYSIYRYLIGFIITIAVFFVAYKQLNSMIPVKESIASLMNRFKK